MAELRAEVETFKSSQTRTPSPYAKDPAKYARDILHVKPTAQQEAWWGLLLTPPYRVLGMSGHNIGKTHFAAMTINWRFDCFDPGVLISTAPTYKALADVLWTEVRIQRAAAGLGGFRGEAACRLWTSPEHWAQGITANKGEAFQGRHRSNMCFILDECVGIAPIFWEALDSMARGTEGHCVLAIGNPTDPSSRAYAESQATRNRDGSPKWHSVTMSSLDHPNIAAELRGEPPPIPNAVSLAQVEQGIADECDPVPDDEAEATDIFWPPGDPNGRWYRPGPVMESRWLGRWPTSGAFGVWSEAAFQAACKRQGADVYVPTLGGLEELPCIGADIARFGDDYTAFHVRHLGTSLHHERHNGWSTVRTAAELVLLANKWAAWLNQFRLAASARMLAKNIPINVDDGGVGGGVTDLLRAQGYSVRPLLAQSVPVEIEKYARLRDELWFTGVVRARHGKLDLSRIPKDMLARLKTQALAPLWKQDASGRRVVESKDEMKKRLGKGSPDDMDALNLAYHETPASGPTVIQVARRTGNAFQERYGERRD